MQVFEQIQYQCIIESNSKFKSRSIILNVLITFTTIIQKVLTPKRPQGYQVASPTTFAKNSNLNVTNSL